MPERPVRAGLLAGSGVRGANDDVGMDANGARALALRIEEEQGSLPEQPPAAAVSAPNAAPIFHWLGIEPPDVTELDAE